MANDEPWTQAMKDWVACTLAKSGPLTSKQLDVIRCEFGRVADSAQDAA